jgi:hypothetical protein
MRSIIVGLGLVWTLAGCGGDHDCGSTTQPPDMSIGNLCPAGAEGPSTAKCDYGHDQTCRSQLGYDCHCACTGYWECDQVLTVCDPDAGTLGD